MKFETDKCHFLFSRKIKINANYNGNKTQTTNQKNVLGITIDSQSKCSWTRSYMDLLKRKTIIKFFITFQFRYCRLIWMFYRRTFKQGNKLHKCESFKNNIHHKTLTFEKLLKNGSSVSIHHRNLLVLPIEMFKLFDSLPLGI